MNNVRIIARLDIKGANLIKGVHLEGLRVIGSPEEYSTEYYHQGADEMLYIDAVASLYGRNNLTSLIEATVKDVFIPITVGGGIRTLNDVYKILRSGADKIAINTAAVKNPEILGEIAKHFGSQSLVLSVEAKKSGPGQWRAMTDNGREKTDLDVVQWCKQAVDLGIGEILLTSIDQEGTRNGFDLDLVKAVSAVAPVPVIASGGMGSVSHLIDVVNNGQCDAVAMADILHYKRMSIGEIKRQALNEGLKVSIHE